MKHTIELDEHERDLLFAGGFHMTFPNGVEVTLKAQKPVQSFNGSTVQRQKTPVEVKPPRRNLKRGLPREETADAPNPIGLHACPYCPMRFSRPGGKGHHIKAQHPERWKPRPRTANLSSAGRLKCPLCTATFGGDSWRSTHIRKFHPDYAKNPAKAEESEAL